jgi:alpha-D-xyloside xylohydrolase
MPAPASLMRQIHWVAMSLRNLSASALLLLASVSTHVGAVSPLPAGVDDRGQLVAIHPEPSDFRVERLQSGVQIRTHDVVKNVLFYGPDIVRVNTTLGTSHALHPSIVVTLKPAQVPLEVKDTADAVEIRTVAMRVVAAKPSGALTFYDAKGNVLTHESRDGSQLTPRTISGAPTYEVRQSFTLDPQESLYGLGQYNDPYMDYRGREVLMVQTNIGIVVPMLVSTRRYGVLWDIYSKSIFKDGADGASLWSESAPAGIDYYLMTGSSMDDVIGGYRRLTGAAPMPPKAAFGLFMSKERYKTQQQLIDVVRKFRSDRFPLDFIVQDWQYWGGADGTWSGMIWDKERYPDPIGLTNTLHNELHVKLMNSIWPSIGNDTALAKELDAKNLRFAPLHWISKQARIYDAFSPEGRAIYFKYINKGLLDTGVDALWMDGTEVEVSTACHDPLEVEADIKGLGVNAMGDFTRYLNVYSLLTTQGTYEGQRATSDKRVFTLTRSAWAGQQRYSALPWSGDTTASWKTLRNQISGGINVAMAGLPYWTQDTGGFFVNFEGGEHNPEYRELFARWNQFAIFNPVYRIHGTSIEREPYVFKELDPPVYQSILTAAQLRYRLLPYIYSLAWKSTSSGYTMMRGLPLDFPDDVNARKIDDAFTFGPAFLVHPVTRAIFNASAPPATTIPREALRTPENKPGTAVQYFEGVNFDKPAGRVVDPVIDYTWPGPPLAEPPGGLTSLNDFSGRWVGQIVMPESGEYEIGVEGDDGYRLWLNDKLVVDNWSNGMMRYRSTRISFAKDQRVAFRLEYFQGRMGRGLRLAWRTPSEQHAFAAAHTKVDTQTQTYLPAGATWYDFWTNEHHAGGATVNNSVTLDSFPVFVRAGSIVPLGPVVQYVNERPDAPYEVRIYSGADGSFTVYEDDGETYAYERGEKATFDLRWNDKARDLTVEPRVGSFPGMSRVRELQIVLIGAAGEVKKQTVTYDGAKRVVHLVDAK